MTIVIPTFGLSLVSSVSINIGMAIVVGDACDYELTDVTTKLVKQEIMPSHIAV